VEDLRERGAAVRFPPPLIYLAAMIGGWAADRWLLPLPIGLSPGARVGAGVIAGLVGLLFGIPALARFRATGQDPKPWEPSPELIQQGIYRLSRNPMYLGLTLLQVGVGLGADNLWIVLACLPALAAVHVIAVRPEETYLEGRFGEDYRGYKAKVRRWL
jgi:protein-S-isoprenylcysteine O-methyltransferase Ste14